VGSSLWHRGVVEPPVEAAAEENHFGAEREGTDD
jgi:hypothetical protein